MKDIEKAFLIFVCFGFVDFVEHGLICAIKKNTIRANEGSVIGTLRIIATCQAASQGAAQVDQDNDGTGEYELLGELTGTVPFRGTKIKSNPAVLGKTMAPLPGKFYAEYSGYRFQMHLYGNVTDFGRYQIQANPKLANEQELRWVCYAWPIQFGVTGNRVFVVDQQAEVYSARNYRETEYGKIPFYEEETAPSSNAAFEKRKVYAKKYLKDINPSQSNDGQKWRPSPF